MTNEHLYLIFLTILILACCTPFGFGRFFISWIVKIFLYTIGSPFVLWRWRKQRKGVKERQQNYELLGHYVALFGNHPEILKYLRHLIESGISTKEFRSLLENNLHNLKDNEFNLAKQKIRSQLEQKQDFHKIAAEQQEILIQSQLSLEQIKFREKLLDNLYQKMQKKYRL